MRTQAAAEATRENVEAILPLLPMQQALLIKRTLGNGDDPGFLQVRAAIEGELDVERFAAAWDVAVARHPALRTSIRPRPDGDPLAVVWRRAPLPLAYDDWRSRTAAECARYLHLLLEADRREGLDLEQAPVMRVRAIRTGERRHEIVWSCHHLLVDGWSAAIVLDDVVSAYADGRGPGDSLLPTLRAFHAQARAKNGADTEKFWAGRLAGFRGAALFGDTAAPRSGTPTGQVTVPVGAVAADAMVAGAAKMQVPINALMQAAWALVLSRLFRSDDVVFGATVAGRSNGIAGFDRMVGYFSNVVPIRVQVDPAQRVHDWLGALRNEQFEMMPFEGALLADIHAWSAVPAHQPLLESLLAVENFPVGASSGTGGIMLTEFRSDLTTTFPVTVAVVPADPWHVTCRYDEARLSSSEARILAGQLVAAAAGLSRDPDAMVGSVLDELDVAGVRVTRPAAAGEAALADPDGRPRDEVELRLAKLWEETLGVAPIGVHDDFFALGGTSIAAVRLFALIEDAFGAKLPLSTLLSEATIAAIAPLLRDGGAPAGELRSLVPIQAAGNQPPIACVHASTGNVLFYRTLVPHLGADQPVFGLEAAGLHGTEAPIASIPEMAARYVGELRSVQPEGPYRLVGYCLGGLVCLEMARRLEAEGQSIDLLVMIDPQLLRPWNTWERAEWLRQERGARAMLTAAARKLRKRTVQHARRLIGRRWDAWFGDASARRRVLQERIEEACGKAVAAFEPRPCATPMTLIRSSTRETWSRYLDDWREMTPDLRLHEVDSHHGELLDEPVVRDVVEIIRSELSRPRG